MDTSHLLVDTRFSVAHHGIRDRHGNGDIVGRAALGDGRAVDIAVVSPGDFSSERAFFSSLSLSSRYRRFHFGLRELSPEQAHAMTELDPQHEVAFVARPATVGADRPIVADARYVLHADSADAEFAIVVADDWQGAGLGRELLQRLASHARRRGIMRLYGDVLWGNSPMLALVRKLGGRIGRSSGGASVVRAEFVVSEGPGADVFSVS